MMLFTNMQGWEVERDEKSWTLLWRFGVMQIGPADLSHAVAVDIATDFMARFEAGDVPLEDGFGHNPGTLMRQCYEAATL